MLTFPKLTIFPDMTMSWKSATLVHEQKAGSVDWTIIEAASEEILPSNVTSWIVPTLRSCFRLAQLLMIGSVGSGAVSL